MAHLLLFFIMVACWGTNVSSLRRNVTEILEHYSDFSNFNLLLTETGVVQEVNRMPTGTLFVPLNADVSLREMLLLLRDDPSMKPLFENICRFHVALQQVEMQHLASTTLPTLFGGTQLEIHVTKTGHIQVVMDGTEELAVVQGSFQTGSLSVFMVDKVLNPYTVESNAPPPALANEGFLNSPPDEDSAQTLSFLTIGVVFLCCIVYYLNV